MHALRRPAAPLALLALALLLVLGPAASPTAAQTMPAIAHLGQLGGRPGAVALRPPYAYVGLGAGLAVLDLTQATPRPLGVVGLPQVPDDIVVAGSYAYVVGSNALLGRSQLHVVSVAQPADPLLVGSIDLNGAGGSLALSGQYLYVGGMAVYSLASPAAPAEVARGSAAFLTRDLAAVPGFVFAAGGEAGLRVYDVRSLPAITEVASFVPGGGDSLTDLAVEGSRLYSFSESLLNGGVLRVFNIAEPAELTRLGSLTGVGAGGEIALSAGRLFWSGDAAPSPTLPSPELRAYDVGDPANLRELGAAPIPEYANDLAVAEGVAVLPMSHSGVLRASVADPARPAPGGAYTPPPLVGQVALDGERALVSGQELGSRAPASSDRTDLLRLGDRRLPQLLGRGSTLPSAALRLAGDYAYAAEGAAGLGVYRVSSTGALVLAGRVAIGQAADLELRGELAYVVDAESGLAVVDISDPGEPRLLRTVSLGPGYRELALGGERAFLAAAYVEAATPPLRILDLSDPAAPAPAGQIEVGAGAEPAATADGRTLYVAEPACAGFSCITTLRIFDVGSPAAPVARGSLQVGGGSPRASAYAAGYLVIGYNRTASHVPFYDGPVRLVDVRNPAAPRLAGEYLLSEPVSDLAIAGPLIYVASGSGGLSILRAEALFSPTVRLHLPQLGR